jgi:hypothetical protein
MQGGAPEGYEVEVEVEDTFAADGGPPPGPWPKECVVDRFRGYRPSGT